MAQTSGDRGALVGMMNSPVLVEDEVLSCQTSQANTSTTVARLLDKSESRAPSLANDRTADVYCSMWRHAERSYANGPMKTGGAKTVVWVAKTLSYQYEGDLHHRASYPRTVRACNVGWYELGEAE